MQRYSDTILNQNGRPVANARVVVDPYVKDAPANLTGTSTSTIYAVDGGPAVQYVLSDAKGRFAFYAADGHYSLTVTGSGLTAAMVADIVLDDPDSATPEPTRRGFWVNDASGANIHRLRDRVFIGESVKHTGRSTAPYGNTWLAAKVATWPEKNAQVQTLSSEEKIGLLAGVQATNASGASAIGLASFSYNERTSGTARAMYADVTHAGPAGASYGLEIAVNNTGADVQTNAYSLPGGVIGLHMTPEGGSGYTLGDADLPATVATAPGTVAVNIGAGSGGTANKRWNLGIRFGSNALTGSDGVTGSAIAIGMARGHTIEWRASNAATGAAIRSDVTAVAGQDVGLLFENNAVSIKSTGFGPNIAKFVAVPSAVNYVNMTSSAAGNYPTVAALGADANVGLFYDTKGTAPHRLRTNGGLNEQVRVSHVVNSVNFLNLMGSVAGSPPQVSAAGSDSDIDLLFQPKGAGMVKFGALVASADAPITGYIIIKDASGVQRKLAVIG